MCGNSSPGNAKEDTLSRVLKPIVVVLAMLASSGDAFADDSNCMAPETGIRFRERATLDRPGTTGRVSPGILASSVDVVGRTTVLSMAQRHASAAAESSVQPGRSRGFVARHPVLVGAIFGAVAGGSVAFARWGSEGTWVGVWLGAGTGGGIGALLSR